MLIVMAPNSNTGDGAMKKDMLQNLLILKVLHIFKEMGTPPYLSGISKKGKQRSFFFLLTFRPDKDRPKWDLPLKVGSKVFPLNVYHYS